MASRASPSRTKSKQFRDWTRRDVLGGFCLGSLLGLLLISGARFVVNPVVHSSGLSALHSSSGLKQTSGQSITENDTIHVVLTTNGSPYQNFQTRIMHGTFVRAQATPLGKKRLKGFTRILHRTTTDILMDEVPTFHALPLTPACDEWCEFPVSDRPDAVRQWLHAVEEDSTLIQGEWLLMLETDYIFTKVPDVPSKMVDGEVLPVAFPFHYIQPAADHLAPIITEMYTEELGTVQDIQGTGPAPVFVRQAHLDRLILDWVRLTEHIENSPAAKTALGWVREMYAFSIAAAMQRPPVIFSMDPPPHSILCVQPPADSELGSAALIHYTWATGALSDALQGLTNETLKDTDSQMMEFVLNHKCMIFSNPAKERVWSFDKRDYTAGDVGRKIPDAEAEPDEILESPGPGIIQPPRIQPLPPLQPDWTIQDGKPVSKDLYHLVDNMITLMNEVIDDLPELAS